ncbi:hypothetical protein V6N13_050365 [Hibiscus sabdariffa]|uniref:Uncharacterized protein n=2 Tax=Hibiscus sabdariffa TaxID=183260 RepID=A0ABR2P4P5_9ROSI
MNNNGYLDGIMTKWYYITPLERKGANGTRNRRCSGHDYWRASAKTKEVFFRNEKVGLRKNFVFYQGKSPKYEKTKWKMHRYELIQALEDKRLDGWVLSRVYKKLNTGESPHDKAKYVV